MRIIVCRCTLNNYVRVSPPVDKRNIVYNKYIIQNSEQILLRTRTNGTQEKRDHERFRLKCFILQRIMK